MLTVLITGGALLLVAIPASVAYCKSASNSTGYTSTELVIHINALEKNTPSGHPSRCVVELCQEQISALNKACSDIEQIQGKFLVKNKSLAEYKAYAADAICRRLSYVVSHLENDVKPDLMKLRVELAQSRSMLDDLNLSKTALQYSIHVKDKFDDNDLTRLVEDLHNSPATLKKYCTL